jgi:predicted DNA-binding protein YlxM (UPF0122 family)
LQNSQNSVLSKRTKTLVEKLRLGKFSLAEIARIIGVSEQWLHSHIDANL